MRIKKLLINILVLSFVSFLATGCFDKKEIEDNFTEKEISQKKAESTLPSISKTDVKKYDLYSATSYDLPLVSIYEISKLSQNVKSVIDKLLEKSQGFYLLKSYDDKIFIILQNPVRVSNTYSRHDLQFVEMDLLGNVKLHDAGYTGMDGEISDCLDQNGDFWLFEENSEIKRPSKHIAYDEKGKVKFTEFWNYEETESVKYKMEDGNKKVISILKESQDNDSNLRKEHVFYDNNGNTVMSLTINYDGANISRITYYNSHDSIDSMSIISEYVDGFKVKEIIYNEDYQVLNYLSAEYSNAERQSITIFDNQNNKIETLVN